MGKATNFRNAKEFSSALFRVFRVSALCKLFNIPKQNTKVLYKNKGILLSVEYLCFCTAVSMDPKLVYIHYL